MTKSTTIPYDEGVTEAREILTRAERDLWRLAEIAFKLEPVHKEATTQRFADDIGLALRTVQNYRQTYKIWQIPYENQRVDEIRRGRRILPLMVARELNAHPDRETLWHENPDLTHEKARELAKGAKPKKPKTKKPKPAPDAPDAPDAKPDPKERETKERALHAYDRRKAAGEPITRTLICEEANVSPIIAVEAITERVTEERVRAEYAPDAKPELSKTKQAQFDAALRRADKQRELEFETRVNAKSKEFLDGYILPHYNKKYDEYCRAIVHRKGVLKYEEYRKLVKCLHTDTIHHLNPSPEMQTLFNEGFRILKHYELALCNEKEKPTEQPTTLPKTTAEWQARKAVVAAEEKAKRAARKAAQQQQPSP